MNLSHIIKEVKTDYERNFLIFSSIDEDIIEYGVDIEACMVAFISICFGKVLSGGFLNLYLATHEPVIFDTRVLFEDPTFTEIFATLISFATENGNPNNYLKDKE